MGKYIVTTQLFEIISSQNAKLKREVQRLDICGEMIKHFLKI